MHRRAGRYDGDLWDIPGGTVENGEEPFDAVVCEFREETGIPVLVVREIARQHNLDTQGRPIEFVTTSWLVRALEPIETVTLSQDEHDAWRWTPLNALDPANLVWHLPTAIAALHERERNKMVTIRPESPADHHAIGDVNRLAFGREGEAGLVEAVRSSDGFIPELSLVAERDDRIVGHILLSRVQIKTDSNTLPALLLGPIAVLPDAQRQGIGGAMIEEAFVRARELGHQVVVLIGHPEYYPRFGFIPGRQLGLEWPKPIPDPVFMARELVPVALDGVTGVIVYPPFFDEV